MEIVNVRAIRGDPGRVEIEVHSDWDKSITWISIFSRFTIDIGSTVISSTRIKLDKNQGEEVRQKNIKMICLEIEQLTFMALKQVAPQMLKEITWKGT